jgi:hypothetical protein
MPCGDSPPATAVFRIIAFQISKKGGFNTTGMWISPNAGPFCSLRSAAIAEGEVEYARK